VKRFVSRGVIATAVLVLWAGVLGWHVRREYFKPIATRLAERARSLAPGTFFYSIKMNGQSIGIASTRLDTLPNDSGFRFTDRVQLDVPALNETHRALAQTDIFMDPALHLRSFVFQLGSEIGDFVVRGTVREDTLLDIKLRSGTGTAEQASTMRIDPGMVLDAVIPIRLAAGSELEVGRTMRTLVFNPSVMAEQVVELKVTARDTMMVPDSANYDAATKKMVITSYDTIPVWRIEQTFGGVTIGTWVDEDGHLVKAESALGYTMERTAYEIADQEWKKDRADPRMASGYGAVIERTAIAANVDLAAVAQADSLRIKLSGVDLKGFDLSGGRQQMHQDTLVITRENAGALRASYALPYRAGGDPATELAATALIQSNSPAIVKVAREIAAGSTDPVEVSRKLNDWVYRELDKDITLSIPSAEQVLAARQGDCNEHTVLYVALARALGLPARSAAGLVHVRGRFYYHAWPEVWFGDRWVAVDPTLGQYPADASHLRFIVGGLARQVELLRLIGRLRLEVV
jgi:hypothetical protein